MNNLDIAVNAAVSQTSIALARMRLLNPSAGLDAKRGQAWCEYGFKENLEFADFYNVYRRSGVGHGAVHKLVDTCWSTPPWVVEGESKENASEVTAWERKLLPVMQKGKFWRWLYEADKRRLVGRYSALILQVRDGGNWNKPVKDPKALVRMIPVWASCIKPKAYNNDQKSPEYGTPVMWEYTESLPNGGSSSVDVHPDRVFILGDYSDDAVGFLEPGFNALVNLEKVEGGSGETFLKNAARQMSLNFDKDLRLDDLAALYGVSVDDLQERYSEVARELNRANDLLLITQGATVTPLVSGAIDPGPTYDVNLQTFAASVDMPSKVLVGMQTGERASSEDQKYMAARCQGRRKNELNFEIVGLFEHLMRVRVIDLIPEFTVMWDDLTEPTKSERLASAKLQSDINAVSLAQGEPVFTVGEIRETAGYDPLEGGDPLPEIEPEGDKDGQITNPTEQ